MTKNDKKLNKLILIKSFNHNLEYHLLQIVFLMKQFQIANIFYDSNDRLETLVNSKVILKNGLQKIKLYRLKL